MKFLIKSLKHMKPYVHTAAIITLLFICCTRSIKAEAKTEFSESSPLGLMATAVDKKIAISWEAVKGADGYEIYEAESKNGKNQTKFVLIKNTKNCLIVLDNKKRGVTYHYYIRAYKIKNKAMAKTINNRIYSKTSKGVVTTVAPHGKSTIKNYLRTAISPIGSTMYVWGGGWDSKSAKAGRGATHIGLFEKWRRFAKKQTASYKFSDYNYNSDYGLDCSGFVGWTIYNILNTKSDQKGYVYFARTQAEKFAEMGFGSLKGEEEVEDYKAGDIMSATCSCGECRHVWIVIGECNDGSVVLVHSTPNGVQITGTVSKDGKKKSEAYKLAKEYMKKYYPKWTKKFPAICKDETYLGHYSQMRWTTTGKNAILSDPEGYLDMDAEEVLEDLFACE